MFTNVQSDVTQIVVQWDTIALQYERLARDHPYITSAKELGGWGQKNGNFCWRSVHADIVDGSENGQKCAEVI